SRERELRRSSGHRRSALVVWSSRSRRPCGPRALLPYGRGPIPQPLQPGDLSLEILQPALPLGLVAPGRVVGGVEGLLVGPGQLFAQPGVVVAKLSLDAAQRVARVLAHVERDLVAVAPDRVAGLLLALLELALLLLAQSFVTHDEPDAEGDRTEGDAGQRAEHREHEHATVRALQRHPGLLADL